MQVEAKALHKDFGHQRVISGIDLTISSGDRWAIVGGNGSGKTTLLRLLSGLIRPSQGTVVWSEEAQFIPRETWTHRMNFAGPYVELIEELSLSELLKLHQGLRAFVSQLTSAEVEEISGLRVPANKPIRFFSSGMKQRLRLTLALLTQSDIVFLDEPTSNLDAAAIEWMQLLVEKYLEDRTLVVGSNHIAAELALCTQQLELVTVR